MSFDGQVLCQRMLIGPWALTIVGKPSVAAPAVAAAAPARNLRREAVPNFVDCSFISSSFGWWRFMDGRPGVVLLVPRNLLRYTIRGAHLFPRGPLGCAH